MILSQPFAKNLTQYARKWFWPLLFALNFALHAPFFSLPPASIHVWRQANTMAVARNFYEEDMNILKPRVDRRKTTDGVTGMQFPSYEWIVASGYSLAGFHEAIPRLINWLLYMAGTVAFYYLTRQVSGSSTLAALGAWCFAWSPELYYHGINALPDVLALTASIAGLAWFTHWREQRRMPLLLLSLVAVTIGGLTKLQFLVVGFPIAVFVIQDLLQRRYTWVEVIQLFVYAVVSVGLTLTWYAYALHLITTSGLADFGLETRPAADLATGFSIIKRNLLSDLPELVLGYGSLILFIIGLWRLVRHKPIRHPWFGPGLAWGGALLLYYFIELSQMRHHTYYLLPLLPVLLLLAVWGGSWLKRFPRARTLFLVLLFSQPVWAAVRINLSRWAKDSPGVAPELYNLASRTALATSTPAEALCVVGPDDSGCIYFYFLHKKGFGFEQSSQLASRTSTGQSYLADCIAQGARYLYTNDTVALRNSTVQPYLSRKIKRVGGFQVWELRSTPDK